ncbi:MFS transporter [Pandoraea communis]|uniref:Bcr/CflA family efflux transporter n=1 Tax=Pandoraea communis TaxID=2508297 RepID=A0A5E4YW44_9BURK|nr:multidrug effflux MFS transporter [Pandoraea communis]VVE52193.1 MFS transporter [Pandoraea communis]
MTSTSELSPALPSERVLLGILGLFMMIAPASTDMYLPGLVTMRHELGASAAATQLTLSYFFLGFAFGQLVWGPLADRFGRRRPMAAGIALYIFGSIGCAFADSMEHMMMWRFVQALGGCAMPVIAQAIVRDVYGPRNSARAFSIMLLVMSVAPIVAPLIGGQMLRFTSWRVIFGILAVFGVGAMAALWRLPETGAVHARQAGGPRAVAASYWHLLRDPQFVGYMVAGGAVFGASFTYITGTPLVYMEYFHVSPQFFGVLFGINIVGMASVTMFNSRRVGQVGPYRLMRIGIVGCAIVTSVLCATVWLGVALLPVMVALLFLFMSLRGIITANSVAGALANHPSRAGAAAALVGSVQYGFGFAAGGLLGVLNDGSPRPLAAVMCGFSVLALIALLTMLRKPLHAH